MTRGVKRRVWIDGASVTLRPEALVGQGGEAEIYDLGDGRVVKWWKPPAHPDFVGQLDAQRAAQHRLDERPAKLRALPAGLPPAVVAPCGLALAAKGSSEVVGYVMPKVGGDPLHAYGEPRWRREHPIDGADVVAVLLALHDAIAGVHRAGVVIGDCNDLNVLVDGRQVHLIDVDSYQFDRFGCPMFSERFVDPRLCEPQQLVPVRPHDAASDWFAFAVMAFRVLLGVGPWGGVHQPADPARRCPPPQRALRRISVFSPDVVYPRAARPLAILPDELADVFHAIFERDQRGGFPREVLARLRLRRCTSCGEEHGRTHCPACRSAAPPPPSVVHGRLRWTAIAPSDVVIGSYEITRTTPIHLDAGVLWRPIRRGRERIGAVLAAHGATRAWCGARFGVGFYRAGGYAVGFVFRPDHGVLDDRVAMPRLRGQLVDAVATIGDDRAWLWLTCADAGRLVTTCVVLDAFGRVLATNELADTPWLAGVAGGCAAGSHLFVPTDAGIVRVEVVNGQIAPTRTFPETAPLVGAGDRLALHPGGIDVLRRRDALRLQLT